MSTKGFDRQILEALLLFISLKKLLFTPLEGKHPMGFIAGMTKIDNLRGLPFMAQADRRRA
jgi:hypothetical protein